VILIRHAADKLMHYAKLILTLPTALIVTHKPWQKHDRFNAIRRWQESTTFSYL